MHRYGKIRACISFTLNWLRVYFSFQTSSMPSVLTFIILDFLKLITYMTFFLIVLAFYGLPLNSIRDIYITARSFFQRCRDLIRYRTATRNMDERYPNATEAELTQLSDRTCIICREEMHHREPTPVPNGAVAAQPNQPAVAAQRPSGVNDTPKKLPCGHVFHFHCLRSWLERQQSCPTCRRTVLDTRPANGPGIRAIAGQGGPGVNAPVPGAVPQPNGNMDGAQPQGLLARWLRGAGLAPPLVPGQFAAGPMVDNLQGQGRIQGQIQQPLQPLQQQQPFGFPNPFGPWLQPQIPQGIPHNPQHQQLPQQQQPIPAPVQVLQGFYIGNQWQPWGQEPQQGQQQQYQPQARAEAQAQQPYPVQTQVPTPTPTIPDPTDTNNISASEGPSASAPSTPAPTPREAAALAALKRLGGPNSQNQNQIPPLNAESTVHTPGHSAGSASATVSPNDVNQNNTIPSSSHLSTTTNHTPFPSASGFTRTPSPYRSTPVPSLIPLFDPAFTSATIVPPPQGPNSSHSHLYSRSPTSSSAHVANSISQLQPDDVTSRELRDLLQSPSLLSLTAEQLARLDILTRETIDERLRILEEVQRVMWRCSEELVRVRSVLPPIPRENDGRSMESSSSSAIPGPSNLRPSMDASAAVGNSNAPNIISVDSSKSTEPSPSGTFASTSSFPSAEANSNGVAHIRSGKEPDREGQVQE